MPAAYQTTRYEIFTRLNKRGFRVDSQPLSNAIQDTKAKIRQAQSLAEIPPFTAIAVEYGKLLSTGILKAFIKGYDASRQRRIRKNSIDIKELVAFDWNLDNVAAVAAFSREAFIMAGVQTEELRQALFEEAKKVFASGGTYLDWANSFDMHGFEPENPYHLRTNYDTAANAAYAAGQWQQIEEYKLYFPYLRYVTMRDEKVRDEHWAMDGLIYPVDDPFWDSYTPPNGWNCRCSVEQLLEGELPDDYAPMEPDTPVRVDPMFKNNPGKSKALYSAALDAIETNWKEAGLPPWTDYPAAAADLINTDGMSYEELIELYANILADQYVIDVNKMPVALLAKKAQKFAENYKLPDIRGRFRYLNCIRDAIQNPYELWLNPDNKRLYYIKKYDKNVVLIVEIGRNNQLEYFNVLLQRDTKLDNEEYVKTGVLLYKK
ncbi:MAG: phage minor head protein [Candidatus Cloacimonetes bacterium]|nr:phage minor head protein [Candidatus Cloacimonadota bacterium]